MFLFKPTPTPQKKQVAYDFVFDVFEPKFNVTYAAALRARPDSVYLQEAGEKRAEPENRFDSSAESFGWVSAQMAVNFDEAPK